MKARHNQIFLNQSKIAQIESYKHFIFFSLNLEEQNLFLEQKNKENFRKILTFFYRKL